MARNYSNIALDTTLTAGITAGDLTCVVASAAGWPAAPFAAVLDPGSLIIEEVVQVTLKVGTTFTITRGFDGTAASIHALGAVVRHAAIAGDFTDLQAADAANALAISMHAALSTSAHGGIVASTDPRLTDSRTPLAHASTHASIGSDPITIAESQVTNLTADLGLKAPLASPTFTGVPAAPTAAPGTNTTQLATTAFALANASGAPSGATYITQTPDAGLSAEQALSLLATGYLKNTTGIGVLAVQATPIPSTDGGTGINNAGTLTNATNTTITGGGTLALAGFTLTVPKTGTAPVGTGTAGRIAEWVTDANTVQASTLAKTGVGVLTLNADVDQSWRSIGTNFGIGPLTLSVLTSGLNNLAFGASALKLVTTGGYNTAVGASSLLFVVGGLFNTAVGYGAISGTSTGSSNVGVGFGALSAGGSSNVGIGALAGGSATGSSNVFIGDAAGQNATGSNKLYIENSNSERPLIGGDFSADTLTFFATDAATAAARTQITLDYSSSGTPAPGFGSRVLVALKSSTTDSRNAADWSTSWATATDASRKARTVGTVYDTAAREWIRGEASGSAAMVGLYGAAAVAQKAAITAPAGGVVIDAEARTAIGLILTALGAAAGGIGITA